MNFNYWFISRLTIIYFFANFYDFNVLLLDIYHICLIALIKLYVIRKQVRVSCSKLL